MKDHPHSIWTLGGIPGGDTGRPSPADLESWGASWHGASDQYLIGVAARAFGQNSETASMPAFIESQRRLRDAIATFEASARAASETLATAQSRLLAAVDASSDCTAAQNAQMIRLTNALMIYTIVLAAIGVVQLGLMIWK
jgi:hypothetical protein